MKRILLLFIFLILTCISFAQKETKSSFNFKLKGFIKTDAILDSRQTIAAREGHFLLYPAAEVLDVNGEDINANPNFNMLSIQTRITGIITGPEAFGAKTSGLIEGAFFGNIGTDINGFRLRHAFVKLDWEKSSLLMGQYWHPMFITEVFPGTISFNTGVPFQPFSRNPQIRFTKRISNLYASVTAASQRDFASTGPNGTSSSYLRNSVIPILNFTLKYKTKAVVLGAGANYITLTPRIVTPNDYATSESIGALSTMAFAKLVINKFTVKFEGIYGANTTDLLMLGGYAVKSEDAVTGAEVYTNTKTLSAWTDLSYGKDFGFGLFAGYTKNLGTEEENLGTYFSRGSNIESVLRVSPRLYYQINKFRFASELEYTSATYGTPNNMGEVETGVTVGNVRFLFAAYLFFATN
ncbi:MAG: hypothetical protein ABFS12_12825 [Bacteroidota bacterium]